MASYGSFSEVRDRLDEIVTQVRKKDLSLEKSLDLYEEAIKLTQRAAELVDKPDFSDEELMSASGQAAPQQSDDSPQASETDAQGDQAPACDNEAADTGNQTS